MLKGVFVPIELRGLAAACPEALTDGELMLVLCNSRGTSERDGLFEEVFRRYQQRVMTWCYRINRNRTSAHDLAQEVFFKASRNTDSFRGDSRLSTWLYAITRNHCLTAIKKMAVDPLNGSEAVPHRLPDFSAVEPDRAIERAQIRRKVWQMMGSALEPMEVRVITLHYGYEIPLATITQRLALSNPSGAKAYVVNARRKLSGAIRRGGLTSGLFSEGSRRVSTRPAEARVLSQSVA